MVVRKLRELLEYGDILEEIYVDNNYWRVEMVEKQVGTLAGSLVIEIYMREGRTVQISQS